MKENGDIEFLFELLFWALIEIREDCIEGKPKSLALSDFLHNIPTELKLLHSGTKSEKDIVSEFIEYAKHWKYKKWITDHGKDYKRGEIMKSLLERVDSQTPFEEE